MANTLELERLSDSTIHSVILEFDPEVPSVYRKCVETLENLEQRIGSAGIGSSEKSVLLVRVKSQLALMAFEMNNHSEAERLATEVLCRASAKDPSFSFAVLIKTQSLHALERHDEEVRAGIESAGSDGFDGHALVYLLAELARRHPESMEWKVDLISRVKSYVSESPDLVKHIPNTLSPEEAPREYVLAVADAIRQLSLEKTARILGEIS